MLFKKVKLVDILYLLPIGIESVDNNGEFAGVIRDVKYRIISREEKKKIRDEKFAKRHPFQWIARVLSLVIESIGDIPVYEEYKRTNEIPDIINEIPSLDLYFLLVAGHVHNYGPIINNIETTCRACDKKQSFNLSLNQVTVDTSEGSFHNFKVSLNHGMEAEDPVSHVKMKYRHLECRRPVLRDALQYEKEYRPNGQSDFVDKIYGNCVVAMYDDQGQPLEEARIRQTIVPMIKKMSDYDSGIMETSFNEDCPKIDTEVIHVCTNCSEDISIFITDGFLYPDRQ